MSNPGITAFSQTWVTPLLRRWKIVVALGVVITVVGVLLLVRIGDAARTLAVLVALGLIVSAVDEVAQAERHTKKWPSYVLAALWFVTGVWALMWPGVTLWALAVVVGVGFIAGGLAELGFVVAYRRELPMWAVWLLDGGFSIVIGVLALAWPGATILALAIILGVRVLFRGLATITFGLSLRRLYLMPTLS